MITRRYVSFSLKNNHLSDSLSAAAISLLFSASLYCVLHMHILKEHTAEADFGMPSFWKQATAVVKKTK